MKHRFGSGLLIIAAILLAWPWNAFSGSGTLVPIVGDDKAKPKNWLDENGKPQGLMIDLLEEIAQRSDLRFSYTLVPWKRALALSEKGRGAIIGFSKTSERQKHWLFTDPMYFDELVLVSTLDKRFDFEGLGSLSGQRLAIKRGTSYGDDFEEARRRGVFKVVETTDRAGQMQMLTRDRVDMVLVSPGRIALETVVAENPWLKAHRDEFVMISPPYKLDPNFLGIPKSMNLANVIKPFNEALASIHADGTYDRIVQRNIDKVITELNEQP